MKRVLKSTFAVCVLAVLAVGLGVVVASDVVVKPGKIEVDWVDASSGLVQATNVSASNTVLASNTVNTDYVSATSDITVDTVWADFLVATTAGSFDDLCANTLAAPGAGTVVDVDDDIDANYDLTVWGKFSTEGTVDPPCVLYDRQTRQRIAELVRAEVPPEKQGGAAVFFNQDTNRLETYVASEGAFYDLQGKVVHQIPLVQPDPEHFRTVYHLDGRTGEIKASQRCVAPVYRIRDGYELDEASGQFTNVLSAQAVSRDEALEVHERKEGSVYDLQGNLLRTKTATKPLRYETEYYLDSTSGEVKTRQKAVYDRYVIKEGYELDSKTGQFIESSSGQLVTKEEAVEHQPEDQ